MDAPTVSRPRHNRRGPLKSSALALLPRAIPSANHFIDAERGDRFLRADFPVLLS